MLHFCSLAVRIVSNILLNIKEFSTFTILPATMRKPDFRIRRHTATESLTFRETVEMGHWGLGTACRTKSF